MSFAVYSFPVANGALFEQKKLRYGVIRLVASVAYWFKDVVDFLCFERR